MNRFTKSVITIALVLVAVVAILIWMGRDIQQNFGGPVGREVSCPIASVPSLPEECQ
jgi:hypothetical protein